MSAAPRTVAVAGLVTVVGVEVVPVAAMAVRGTGFGMVSVDGTNLTVVGSMTAMAVVTAEVAAD